MTDLLPRLSEVLPPDLYASLALEFKKNAPRKRESYRNQYLIEAANLLTGDYEDRAESLSTIASRWTGRDSKKPVLHYLFLARQFGKIPGAYQLKNIFKKTMFAQNIVATSGENESAETSPKSPEWKPTMSNEMIEIFQPMEAGAIEFMRDAFGHDWHPRRYQFRRRVLELLALASDLGFGNLRLRCNQVEYDLRSEPRNPPTQSELFCHFARAELFDNHRDDLIGILTGERIYDLLIQNGLRSEPEHEESYE